ncbi:hypothetical protein Acsp04_35770 [Actinomadura sp. NBRC 104425]|nr:hypothetical protein Acsp04_35770 [Actinomadura sp. NBRC 104425]
MAGPPDRGRVCGAPVRGAFTAIVAWAVRGVAAVPENSSIVLTRTHGVPTVEGKRFPSGGDARTPARHRERPLLAARDRRTGQKWPSAGADGPSRTAARTE